jgi:heme/copper-type cytochrome/quinol oxidase subunit 2
MPAQVVKLAVVVMMMMMVVVVMVVVIMKSWDCNGFRTDRSIPKQTKRSENHHVLPLGDPQLCTSLLFKFLQHQASSFGLRLTACILSSSPQC